LRLARWAAPEGPRLALADPTVPQGDALRWLDLGLATSALPQALLSGAEAAPGIEIWPELPLLAPLDPKRIFASGRNDRDHARERHEKVPSIPLVWVKLNSAVTGPGAPIPVPPGHAEAIVCEGQLALVIGPPGWRLPEERALEQGGGYTSANDVTARDAQDEMLQWTLPKSIPASAPLGPHLLTREELPDPQQLSTETRVGDERRQQGQTKDMIFTGGQLISFPSEYVDLEVGDVIETGTPAGVGWSRKPKALPHAGLEVEVRIEPIGALRNLVLAEALAPGD
jgi:2-keto-4-pentenoate hydratase/2-oxohepta-3-ene-1,7-dioic acid hydratase in catechol pathway